MYYNEKEINEILEEVWKKYEIMNERTKRRTKQIQELTKRVKQLEGGTNK